MGAHVYEAMPRGEEDQMEKTDMPMQPISLDEVGTPRFRKNAIVCWLLDAGPFDMNQIAMLPGITQEERMQFAQQIGYSVSGFGDLSYASDAVVGAADDEAEKLLREQG